MKTIKRIFHLSDIHIRPLARHDEYRAVFDKVYESLQAEGARKKGSLIVITGDIFHEKDKLKPETVDLCREFFKRLIRLCEKGRVVVICGNHDLIENNMDRLDNLTAVLDGLDLDYLKNTGIYEYGNNVDFYLSSIIDKQKLEVGGGVQETRKGVKKIGLFHGMVEGCGFDSDNGRSMKKDYFKGLDCVMLGDIHKHMNLGGDMVYPGSLIQQNFGESYEGHGYVKWKIGDKIKYKFKEIKNDWGYINIHCRGGKIIGGVDVDVDERKMPEKCRIRLHIHGDEENQVEKVIEKINGWEGVEIIQLDKRLIKNDIEDDRGAGVVGDDNFDDMDAFREILSEKKIIGEENEVLTGLHERYKGKIDMNGAGRVGYGTWKIMSLEWKNMFIYGGGDINKIELTDNVIGILGKNAIGKSCIMRILLFSIYERCGSPRSGFDRTRVINKGKDECFTRVRILMGGQVYVIERVGKRRKRGDKESSTWTCQFYVEGGENLNGEHNKLSNVEISKVLGLGYNDFLLTCIFSGSIGYGILDCGEAERLEIFNRFLRLGWYKMLYGEVRGDLRRKKGEMSIMIGKLKVIKEGLRSEKKIDQGVVDSIKVEIKNIDKKIKKMSGKIITGDPDIIKKVKEMNDIKSVKKELKKLGKGVGNKGIGNVKDIRKELTETRMRLMPIRKEYNLESVSKKLNELNKVIEDKTIKSHESEGKLNDTRAVIEYNIREYGSEIDSINLISKEEYDVLIGGGGMDGKSGFDLFEGADIKPDDKEIDYYNRTVNSCRLDDAERFGVCWYKRKRYQLWTEDKGRRELQLKIWKYELETVVKKIKWFETSREIEEWSGYLKLLRDNKEIESKIARLEKELRYAELIEIRDTYEILGEQEDIELLRTQRDSLNKKLVRYKDSIKRVKRLNKECSEVEKELEIIERDINILGVYKDIVDKNGLPLKLSEIKLGEICKDVNKIMERFCRFKCEIKLIGGGGDKPRLSVYCVKGGIKLGVEDMSGYESFVMSIAFKIALSRRNFIGKSSCICIDEGLDCIDENNFERLGELIGKIMEWFDCVLLITHIPGIEKYIDRRIKIENNTERGFSKIY